MRVWDTTSRQMVQAFPVVPIAGPGIVYSPDRRVLAVTAWDGSVILCDTANGQPVVTLRGHKGRVHEALAIALQKRQGDAFGKPL